MKLVIEVSDIAYEAIMYEKENTPKDMDSFELLIALATPLEEVLEDIKAEIDTYLQAEEFGSEYRNDVAQIIDKHISGKDQ